MTAATRTIEQSTAEMVLPKHSIADLDLMSLPHRLDDSTLAMVRAIASAPPLVLPSCPDRHFSQCLRIMLAVLPKRVSDDLSGELFVSAYQRQIGNHPQGAISFLADTATRECQWFPTIAECLAIIERWQQPHCLSPRGILANRILIEQRAIRDKDARDLAMAQRKPMTQSDVDGMSETLLRIGIAGGWIKRRDDGRHVLSDYGPVAA
jgi:hypothetical protein